jgi:5-methylcytosine-specific restriction endonuclease McrA
MAGAPFTKIPLSVLLHVRSLFGGRCAYCPKKADTIDHFMPICLGGPHRVGNLLPACRSCNVKKSGVHPSAWLKNKAVSMRKLRKALRKTL